MTLVGVAMTDCGSPRLLQGNPKVVGNAEVQLQALASSLPVKLAPSLNCTEGITVDRNKLRWLAA